MTCYNSPHQHQSLTQDSLVTKAPSRPSRASSISSVRPLSLCKRMLPSIYFKRYNPLLLNLFHV